MVTVELLHCILGVFIFQTVARTEAKYSKKYNLPGKYCGKRAKEIDGAIIYSSDSLLYANNACILRFEADDSHFTTKRMMFHLQNFTITSCNVELKVYFDDDTYGTPDYVYDCNTAGPGVAPMVLLSSGKYLTLRLDKTTTTGYSFIIVLTTFRERSICSELDCGEHNGNCIDTDLYCDGVRNCLDGRDEYNCSSPIQPTELGWRGMVSGVIVLLLICGGCVGLGYFICRRRRSHAGTVIRTNQPMAPPPAGTYPTQQPAYPAAQPAYPATQPAYGSAAYPPAAAPTYPPGAPPTYPQQAAYPPPPPGQNPAYPPMQYAQQPPAYTDNPYAAAPPQEGPYAPPPPFNMQQPVNYNASEEKVQL